MSRGPYRGPYVFGLAGKSCPTRDPGIELDSMTEKEVKKGLKTTTSRQLCRQLTDDSQTINGHF